MILSFKLQKYIFVFLLLLINILLCYCLAEIHDYWYLYLIVLTPNSFFTILMILTIFISGFFYFCKKENKQIINKNILYLLPCYNESYDELNNTINSFIDQVNLFRINKILIICCDGMVTGKNNCMSTNKILEQILKDYIIETIYYKDAYKTWTNEYNNVYLSYGKIRNLPFVLIIKENNIGKRDSVTLIRRNSYLYNNKNNSELFCQPFNDLTNFNKQLFNIFQKYNINNIDAIIGTDGDTILHNECATNLIDELYNYKDDSLMGVAGFIKISNNMNPYSLWTIYQHTSYYYGQLLVRLHQSRITRKVNCLPGCVQIFKVCKETCGYEILNIFNNLPDENELLHRHMRAHMGEDRMHVCTMMHMYPYIKTKQSINAFVYTKVPNTWKVFLSQRRRWNMGANSNKLLLLSRSGINYYEKLFTFVSVLGWFFTIFYTFAVIHILIVLIKLNYTDLSTLMYVTIISLSVIIILPKLYILSFPLWINMNKKEIIHLYIGCLFWHFMNIPMTLLIHLYTLFNMDNLSWGKTRECCDNEQLTDINIVDNYNNTLTPRNEF
jgi:chitin synthase